MAPSEAVPKRLPAMLYLADSLEQGVQANAMPGDFLGIVGTQDTFERGPTAWQRVHPSAVQQAFDDVGGIGVRRLTPPTAPPPYSASARTAPSPALATGKAAL